MLVETSQAVNNSNKIIGCLFFNRESAFDLKSFESPRDPVRKLSASPSSETNSADRSASYWTSLTKARLILRISRNSDAATCCSRMLGESGKLRLLSAVIELTRRPVSSSAVKSTDAILTPVPIFSLS